MKRISRNILAAILATAGILIIFCIPITNYMITSFHPKVEQQKSYNVPYNWDDVKLINLFSVIKARIDHPEIHVIGAIYNEKIKLNTPVAEGVDNTIFSLCASTLYPNEKMGKGNYTIAAHNVRYSKTALFSPIYHNVDVGNQVNVTDFNTNYTYQIIAKKVTSPQDYSALSPTKQATLTLITCDRTNKKREIYTGKLVKTVPFNQLSQHTKNYLAQKFER